MGRTKKMSGFSIYDYFYSPDIAEHCKKIRHEFSPLDMAVIVKLSDKTLNEKHTAWQSIINEFQDMPIRGNNNFDARDSLFEFLRELIEWDEKKIKDFYIPDGAVYRPAVHRYRKADSREISTIDDMGCFSVAEKAWEKVCVEWDFDFREDGVAGISIKKEYPDHPDSYATISFDTDGDIIEITGVSDGNWDYGPGELDMIFIHIPLPFVEGDLVDFEGKPYVLTWLPHMDEDKDRYWKKVDGSWGSDGSDMVSNLMWVSEDADFYPGVLMQDHGPPFYYWELKYFRGELKSPQQSLKYISQHMKTGNHSVDWLINMFNKFKADTVSVELNKLFGGWYLPLCEEESGDSE
ncbi:MAG: hypothetical protein FWG09_04690 [Synergistaceae bacterium]|nr:hypothetical protein [Synergistaceae bacterium]